jgi:plasmid maintenance system antidote protein VapI
MTVDAYLTPDELTERLDDSGMSRARAARLLDVTPKELAAMETGEESIPARFDDDIWQLELPDEE